MPKIPVIVALLSVRRIAVPGAALLLVQSHPHWPDLHHRHTHPRRQVAGGRGKKRVKGAAIASINSSKICPFHTGCVIVALLHKFEAKVPGAEDTLLGGDRVVVVTKQGNASELHELLCSGPA